MRTHALGRGICWRPIGLACALLGDLSRFGLRGTGFGGAAAGKGSGHHDPLRILIDHCPALAISEYARHCTYLVIVIGMLRVVGGTRNDFAQAVFKVVARCLVACFEDRYTELSERVKVFCV
jgi:hypothetical protein